MFQSQKSEDMKLEHTSMQIIQPIFRGFDPVFVSPKCANQTWRKKNKNSRL